MEKIVCILNVYTRLPCSLLLCSTSHCKNYVQEVEKLYETNGGRGELRNNEMMERKGKKNYNKKLTNHFN